LPALAEPSIFLNRADFERIRETIASAPWAAKVRDRLIARADDWPAAHVKEFGLKEWALPPEGAGWSHSYVCPDHGVRLRQSAGKNLCPVDGKDFHGWPWDHVSYMMRHHENAEAMRDLGLAWQLTGRRDYAEKARRIVNAYSALYPTLPIHDNSGQRPGKRGARVMSQTLTESSWAVPLVFGYDLLRDALTMAERDRFERDVLREAGRVIGAVDAGKSNWQARHNAALLAIGLAVGDRELAKRAIDGPSGFKFHMRESVTPDGPWYEGAWGYHYYSLLPLLSMVEMAERAHIPLPEAAVLKKMFDAPLRAAFPDGTLPAFNDSGRVQVRSSLHYYEAGYRLFRDPRYLPWLRLAERDLDALLWGVATLPDGSGAQFASELMKDAGVATLRAKGSDHTLAIKFGPHGGGHGHYDKLTFVSFANGAHMAVDPGTQAYAAKTHATWDKTTVAHNTVVVDGRNQAEATGKLLDWMPRDEGTMIRLGAGAAYEGVDLERTVVHTAGWTLDIFEARSTDGKSHRARGAVTASEWDATFMQPGAGLRLRMAAAPGTTVVAGEGLGPDLRVPVPFVLVRRTGTAARFVAVYEPFAKTPRIRAVREASPGAFTIEREGGVDRVTVGPGRFELSTGK
jgi:hypothetical protein